MFGLGPLEIVVIGAIAVMMYGRRLPEVGRSFGKTLGDLRRQWTTLARELDVTAEIDGRLPSRPANARRSRFDADTAMMASPRFDPPSPTPGLAAPASDAACGGTPDAVGPSA